MKNNTRNALVAVVAAATFAMLPAIAMADDMSNMNMSGSANSQNNNKSAKDSGGANTKNSLKSKKSSSAM